MNRLYIRIEKDRDGKDRPVLLLETKEMIEQNKRPPNFLKNAKFIMNVSDDFIL